MRDERVDQVSSIAMMKCPRFESCSAPICPLDTLQKLRDYRSGESKCTLSKTIRRRIGRTAGLEHEGLTKSEWVAEQRWGAMTDNERKQRTAHLRRFSANLKRKTTTLENRE